MKGEKYPKFLFHDTICSLTFSLFFFFFNGNYRGQSPSSSNREIILLNPPRERISDTKGTTMTSLSDLTSGEL